MKLSEVVDEFENQESSLLDLARKRQARSNEIQIFLNFLKKKYPSLDNITPAVAWSYWKNCVNADPNIDEKEKTKFTLKYERWMEAKKQYENAGGKYRETFK